MAPAASQVPWTYVAPLIAIVVVVLRGARERALRIERMWIMPAFLLLAVVASFAAQPPPRLPILAAAVVGLALGAVAGWWRGKATNISVDAATHALTSRASPLGMVIVIVVMFIRIGLRDFAMGHAGDLHVSATEITDVFLMFAAGLVCTQRLEMWLRARRLLEAARKP